MIWFYVHIRFLLMQKLFAGIPISVMWMVNLAGAVLLFFTCRKKVGAWAKINLARASTTRVLLGSVAVISILYLTTSSLYFEYDDEANAEAFIIEVKHHEEDYLGPLELSKSVALKGRPWFFRMSNLLNPATLQ
ncbi:MAG: hypothetical protein GY809_01865, partial [Planctomycetes bacterium]|nr:hypothetical protein [Planctomycetota bacterium]